MQLSQRGIDFIKGFESLRLNSYQDSAGIWTIGYGHTGGVRPGQQITSAQAEALLKQDVAEAESAVNSLVAVPLTQSQFDALVSLTFNWGAGNLAASILLKRLNAGDYEGAAQRLSEHPITSGGRVVQGLVRRRREEAALFRSGEMPANPQPPPASPLATKPGARPGAKISRMIQRLFRR